MTRTIKLSDHYSIEIHPDGKRVACRYGKSWIPLQEGCITWELIDYILKHEPRRKAKA